MVNKKYSILFVMFGMMSFNIAPTSHLKINKTNFDNINLNREDNEVMELNFENVKLYMQEIDIHFPDIVFKQARIESGNFKSRICIENNNLFGMRLARKRNTTAVGENRKYAVYDDWRHSVDDYKLWQEYHNITEETTKNEYLQLLGRIYAEDSTYVNKIR